MAKKKITVEVCDNPRCKQGDSQFPYQEEVYPNDTPSMGYHLGKGTWTHGGGGDYVPPTYACCAECIVPAVEANIYRGQGHDPLTGDNL